MCEPRAGRPGPERQKRAHCGLLHKESIPKKVRRPLDDRDAEYRANGDKKATSCWLSGTGQAVGQVGRRVNERGDRSGNKVRRSTNIHKLATHTPIASSVRAVKFVFLPSVL
jgi:hypothetical protein